MPTTAPPLIENSGTGALANLAINRAVVPMEGTGGAVLVGGTGVVGGAVLVEGAGVVGGAV